MNPVRISLGGRTHQQKTPSPPPPLTDATSSYYHYLDASRSASTTTFANTFPSLYHLYRRVARLAYPCSRMQLLTVSFLALSLYILLWTSPVDSASISNSRPSSSSSSMSGFHNEPAGTNTGRQQTRPDVTSVGFERIGSEFPLSSVRKLYSYSQDGGVAQFNVLMMDPANPQSLIAQPSRQFPPVRHLPSSERKRILVTGGAGFVGSHLVDRLMMMGHEVTVIDNFFTGDRNNVQHWLGHPNFELVRHDVVDPIMLEVDEIYHLACPASPPHYQYNPIKTVKTSVMGTINMLGLAKRVRAKFLLTSTSEVYGDPEVHPQVETYWGNVNPIGPRACYDEGKRVAETLTYAYAKQDRVQVRVARIFNTFGPRMNQADGRVVSNFIMQALKGDDLTVYGDGKQTRSFQYVHDLVDGLMALMESNYTQPVNLGNPEEFTIRDFAEMIRDEVNPAAKIVHLPATTDDPQKRRPDIGRAKTELGWEPRFPVHQGIHETVQYFRDHLMRDCEDKTKCLGESVRFGKTHV